MTRLTRFIPGPVRWWLGLRDRDRAVAAERRAAGLCPECGVHRAASTQPRCVTCQCDLGW